MNNCPKCGNPLQPGTVSCPICGTNIQQNQAPSPAANQNINVSASNSTTEPKEQTIEQTQAVQPATPVVEEAKPVVQEAPVTPTKEPVKPAESVAPTPAPVVQNLTVAPTPETQSVTPVAKAPATAPVQPSEPTSPGTPTKQEIVTPVSEAKPEIKPEPQPVQTPVAPASVGVVPTPVPSPTSVNPEPTPNISKVEQGTPAPSIPASLTNTNNSLQANTLTVEAPKEEKKAKGLKLGKKNITIIAVAAIIVVIGAVLALNMGKGNTMKPNANTPTENNIIASNSAGYKFSLPPEWSIVEDGTNVILKNSDDKIIIKLENIQNSFTDLNEEKINKYFENLESAKDVNTISTQISGKEAYLITATVNNFPIQIYYINSGSRLITGATIIYQDEDIKSSSDAIITELLGTLSFADESVNAIDILNMYSNTFNIYKGIINYKEPTISDNTPENNPENNDENNGENNIIDQPVQAESQPNENNGVEPTPDDNQNNNSEN